MIENKYSTKPELTGHLVENQLIKIGATFFPQEVDTVIAELINKIIEQKLRVRIFYGDRITGKDYCLRFDTIGYIIRTKEIYPQAALVKEKGSFINCKIDLNSIVKITVKKKSIYEHPGYYIHLNIKENDNYFFLYKYDDAEAIFSSNSKTETEREMEIYQGKREK